MWEVLKEERFIQKTRAGYTFHGVPGYFDEFFAKGYHIRGDHEHAWLTLRFLKFLVDLMIKKSGCFHALKISNPVIDTLQHYRHL